jgi:undecaprenyl-diphosphatase
MTPRYFLGKSRIRGATLPVAIFTMAAAVMSLGQLASEIIEGETLWFDKAIMLALRDPSDLMKPVGPPWIESACIDITSLGSLTVLALVTSVAIGYLVIARNWTMAALVVVSVGGGALLTWLLKHWIARPRPDLVPHLVEVSTLSFPSGHAMQSAVVYLTLGALLAKINPQRVVRFYIMMIAILLTILVGVSRVFLGVHWPTDVLAGWCAGSLWSAACSLFAARFQSWRYFQSAAAGLSSTR